jgi:hypothetical protein
MKKLVSRKVRKGRRERKNTLQGFCHFWQIPRRSYFFFLIISTTAVLFRCSAFFTGMNFPVRASRPILNVFAITDHQLSSV